MADEKSVSVADPSVPYRNIREITIEIGDEKNRSLMCPISKERLRGWWKRSNLIGVSVSAAAQSLPDLPGIYVILDCRKKTIRYADPLSFPENADLLTHAQKIVKEVFRDSCGPEKEVVQENLNENDLKTALYWFRRIVDSKQAALISGSLPEMEQILALPGRTKIESWNSSSRASRFREDEQQ